MYNYCGSDSICGEISTEFYPALLETKIHSAAITPNPVNQNQPFLMEVKVMESIKTILRPVVIYCGMFSCGQSIDL